MSTCENILPLEQKLNVGAYLPNLLDDHENTFLLKNKMLSVVLHYAKTRTDLVSPEDLGCFDMLSNTIMVCEDYIGKLNEYYRNSPISLIIYNRFQDLLLYEKNFFSEPWYCAIYNDIVYVIKDALSEIYEIDTSRLEFSGISRLCFFAEALYNKTTYFYQVAPYGLNFYPRDFYIDANADDVSGITNPEEVSLDSVKEEPVKVYYAYEVASQPLVEERPVYINANEVPSQPLVEFYLADENVNAKPAEAQSSDVQSAEAQSSDAQPAEAQPAEAQSSDVQSADTQSAEAQPVDEHLVDEVVDESASEQPEEEDANKDFWEDFRELVRALNDSSEEDINTLIFDYHCLPEDRKNTHPLDILIYKFYIVVITRGWFLYKTAQHTNPEKTKRPIINPDQADDETHSFEVFVLLFRAFIRAANSFLNGNANNGSYEYVAEDKFNMLIDPYMDYPEGLTHQPYYMFSTFKMQPYRINTRKPKGTLYNRTGIIAIAENVRSYEKHPLSTIGKIFAPLSNGKRPIMVDAYKNDKMLIFFTEVSFLMQPFLKEELPNMQVEIHKKNIRDSNWCVNYFPNKGNTKTHFFHHLKFTPEFKQAIRVRDF